MLANMKDMLTNAYKNKNAVLAYNTQGGNTDITLAICKAAEEMQTPIILAHYSACSEYAGLEFFADTSIWCAKQVNVPVAVHLDHSTDVDLCKKAIDVGFTSVMYDGCALSVEENAKNTKEVLEYANKHNVSVEAELGTLMRIGIDEAKDNIANCVDINDVRKFLSIVTPDALAVAIGNAHGVYIEKPVLNFDLLCEITSEFKVPLVLHGGTGLDISQVQRAIKNGVAKVNKFYEVHKRGH